MEEGLDVSNVSPVDFCNFGRLEVNESAAIYDEAEDVGIAGEFVYDADAAFEGLCCVVGAGVEVCVKGWPAGVWLGWSSDTFANGNEDVDSCLGEEFERFMVVLGWVQGGDEDCVEAEFAEDFDVPLKCFQMFFR